jgi:hypothetical protein
VRTTDFSLAPVQGRAEAMLVTERRFATATQARSARAKRRTLVTHLRESPGYLWHKLYRRAPLTLGVVVYFGERAELEAALDSVPPGLGGWVSVGGDTPAGRILTAEPTGYTNGLWRAEDGTMAHIERFSPTSVEHARGAEPPLVAATSPGRAPKNTRRRHPQRPWQPISDTHAMFLGATKYTGPAALIALSRIYYPMIRRMVTMRGYVWFTTYYEFPFTLGTLAFFEKRDDLLGFARMPGHRHLMQWITKDTRNGTAGYIRLHTTNEGAHGTHEEPVR